MPLVVLHEKSYFQANNADKTASRTAVMTAQNSKYPLSLSQGGRKNTFAALALHHQRKQTNCIAASLEKFAFRTTSIRKKVTGTLNIS